MTAAREKVESVLRSIQQRQEKKQRAASAWQQARSRCLTIAQAILDGTGVSIRLDDDRLTLEAKQGGRAVFVFDPRQLAMVGTRFKADGDHVGDVFFSLRIEPPSVPVSAGPGQWGPQRPEGISALTQQMGSQEAFEKAVADWYEWSHIGEGAPPAGA